MSKHFFFCLIGSILAITLRHDVNFINVSLGIIFIIYLILRERKSLPAVVITFVLFFVLASFNIQNVPKNISGQYKIIETHENYLVLKGKEGKFVSYDDYDFLVGTEIDLKERQQNLLLISLLRSLLLMIICQLRASIINWQLISMKLSKMDLRHETKWHLSSHRVLKKSRPIWSNSFFWEIRVIYRIFIINW